MSTAATALNDVQKRLAKLENLEIDFIPNAQFEAQETASRDTLQLLDELSGKSDAPEDLPAHLKRMCDSELLSHEQESALFREMNFLKFHAHKLIGQLDPMDEAGKVADQLDRIESAIATAQRIRDHIITANTRLVMSIVKKFVTPQQSFDDLLSDGMIKLMHAVEKFDFDRGFRFSTYAYRSISRHAYRMSVALQQEEARYTRDAEEWAFEQADEGNYSSINEQVWNQLRDLASQFLDRLDRREKLIVRSRFALGSHRKVRTFQYLADKLGVSKERARQLEKRALTKLQKMASECPLDDILSASMA